LYQNETADSRRVSARLVQGRGSKEWVHGDEGDMPGPWITTT